MAVTSTFDPGTGILATTGDGLDNAITTSRNAAGNILVNGGAVPILGGAAHGRQHQPDPGVRPGRQRHDRARPNQRGPARRPTCSAASRQRHDHRRCGQRPALRRGRTTTLSSAAGGFDILFGGAGNDTLTGGDADDQVFGESRRRPHDLEPGRRHRPVRGRRRHRHRRGQRRQRRRGSSPPPPTARGCASTGSIPRRSASTSGPPKISSST